MRLLWGRGDISNLLNFQRQALENASTNAEVLQVMGNASKALKAAHNNMDIDQVQKGGLTTKLIRNFGVKLENFENNSGNWEQTRDLEAKLGN